LFSVVTLNKEGDILSKWFGKTIIHSDRRFSYEEAQDIIEVIPVIMKQKF
jgi:ribonuclease R